MLRGEVEAPFRVAVIGLKSNQGTQLKTANFQAEKFTQLPLDSSIHYLYYSTDTWDLTHESQVRKGVPKGISVADRNG